MKRGTTYPITLTIPDIDLTAADWVIVSVKSINKSVIEFTGDQLGMVYEDEKTTVIFALTQAQSLALADAVQVDCNWMLGGVRGGALPITLNITSTLLQRVVE